MPDIVFLNSIQPPKRQTIFVLFVLENKARALDLSVDYNLKKNIQHSERYANFQFLLAEALVFCVTVRSYLVNFPLKTISELPPHRWPQSFHRDTQEIQGKLQKQAQFSITTLFPRALGKAGSEQRCLHDLHFPP